MYVHVSLSQVSLAEIAQASALEDWPVHHKNVTSSVHLQTILRGRQNYCRKSLHVQENLYEDDLKDKAKAASCIANLFKQAQHLEPLLSHATLLPTLARVLRDDGKRSMELCIAIQSVWLVLSNFSQFHQLLIENQVGVLTLEVLDLEIKRTEHRIQVILAGQSCLLVGLHHIQKLWWH